jgi:hypothetical protein
MRRVANVFPIMAAAALLTGCGSDAGGGLPGVAGNGAGFVPLSEMRSLPEGHPPLRGHHPALPEGHPPLSWQHPALPEGHPPVYQSQPKCPAGTRTPQPRLEGHPGWQLEAHGLIST